MIKKTFWYKATNLFIFFLSIFLVMVTFLESQAQKNRGADVEIKGMEENVKENAKPAWRSGSVGGVTNTWILIDGEKYFFSEEALESMKESEDMEVNPVRMFSNVHRVKYVNSGNVITGIEILSYKDSSIEMRGE